MDRVAELNVALKAATDEADAVIASLKDETTEDGTPALVASTEQAKTFRDAYARAAEIKGLIDAVNGVDQFKAYLEDPTGAPSAAVRAAAAAAGGGERAQFAKTLGERFTGSEEFKELVKSGGLTMRTAWDIEGVDLGGMWRGGAGQKDVYTTLPTGPSIPPIFGQVQRDPLVPMLQRTTRVRDLFPVQQTNANLIDFFRVSGFTNAASVVSERDGSAFGLKPQSSLAFESAQASVRTIAHFEVAHRNVLADEPQLQGLINNELLYGLRLHEDYQILLGTGTGEDLLGILKTPGIQLHDADSDPSTDNKADAIRRAATKAILAYFEPTGAVLHPYDWEEIELTKDSQQRYLITGAVAVGADKRLWRMPVVDTPAMTQKRFLVGAFGLGAQLYDREQGSIRIAEQHADFFVRNAVVVLAEERLALAVKRPESFIRGDFKDFD